jgi:hypothetical protein
MIEMFTKQTGAGLTATVFLLFATSVGATTINFNVDRSYTNGFNSYTSTDGSVAVGVDGVRVDNSGTIISTSEFWTASWDGASGRSGLGVYDCSWRSQCLDNHLIDGRGPDEFALIDFGDLTVEVTSVVFSYWDRRDTFAFGTYDSTALPATALIYEENLDDGNSNPYTHYFGSGEVIGSIIGFGADSWRDDFKLQSISFNVLSAVPVPAGAVLLLTGLCGLGFMRRRRQFV